MEEDEAVLPLQTEDNIRAAEPWETGFKDRAIAFPGEVTRIRAYFARTGQFVWHCHILEHEDNEMLRPFQIGPEGPLGPHEDVSRGFEPGS